MLFIISMQDNKLKGIDFKKMLPIVVVFLIAVLYGIGVKNYKKEIENMILQRDNLVKEVQDLRIKSQREQEIITNFMKIQSSLAHEEEVARKVLFFYSVESISYNDGYFIIEPFKSSTVDSMNVGIKQTEDLTSQSIIYTLMEVKKCRQIFKSSCVIQQLYPLQLKVYFLP